MKRLVCAFTLGILVFLAAFPASANVARFGYYWKDGTLPYAKEFSYSFDVAAYPDGVFADSSIHSWAYITSQNKHVVYNGVPYSVEAVMQYGFFTDNTNSIKRLWVFGIDDPSRFVSWWIDDDADGHDYWELSTLQARGYLFRQTDPEGDELWFLRVRMQTVHVSESKNPEQTVWENRISLYNAQQRKWHIKARNEFVLDATSSVVRQSTYEAGSGIWSSILETEGNEAGAPDFGKPPVKKIVFMNRSIRIKGGDKGKPPALNETNNAWVDSGDYTVYYRSTPVFHDFAAGSE